MSNANACEIFSYLGIELSEDGWCGTMDARTFLAKVLVALAMAPEDNGRETYEESTGTGARVIYCGRYPQYTQIKLDALRKLAILAKDNNRVLVWA